LNTSSKNHQSLYSKKYNPFHYIAQKCQKLTKKNQNISNLSQHT
jgi:hypothetical protein